MISSGRHPKKAIAEAIKHAREQGLIVIERHSGHRWGVIVCMRCKGRFSVWCTPRVPENDAAKIHRFCARHRECS
ncbi:hypothetical protein [Saccharopolyspora flava]|uniref:hypothetical protein n=1 Tax=Saccharopolyspora flava TaxID=95161 RepID=UPI001114A143|nr:hypothetical protein [Saccharopolyspora flava]